MRKHSFACLPGSAVFAGLLSFAALPHAVSAPVAAAPTPITAPVIADASPAEDSETTEKSRAAGIIRSLHYQQGEVTLGDGLAKLNVPPTFRYLNPQDANKVLHELWGNPPSREDLGLLVPADVSLDDDNCWAVVISYDEQGYVKDDEAATLDYRKLLTQMQEATRAANKERLAEGYRSMELVGWAAPPRYDKATNKMYWAKELKVQGSSENTLNYNIRILGRRGVLVLNAIAAVTQLPEIERAAPAILSMVDFKEGHRYADFNPKTDKVAAVGIAALVAGGVAVKMGLFKGLLVALLAAKKFLIIGGVAAVGWLKRLFGASREKRM